MNSPNHDLEEYGELFIDESDVIHEVDVVEEDVPDVDDDEGAGAEVFGRKESVSCLSFSSDGQLLASGCVDGHIQIWDMSGGKLKCTLEGPEEGPKCVRWDPKGHLVLAGIEDNTVWMWNAGKAAFLNMFSGHGGSVTCGDFVVGSLVAHTNSVETIALSKSSHWAASRDADRKLIIWDLQHSTPRFTCENGVNSHSLYM
ncbi:WD40 repeat [Dillenia turbinata]|uniref:WD40 repeat n=1 Tax=Dillenia turbinata TaxID=194707 RepID=A0AAN8VU50_9MAGN